MTPVYVTHKGIEVARRPPPRVINHALIAEGVVWEDFRRSPAERRCEYTMTPDGQGWQTTVEVDRKAVKVYLKVCQVVSEVV